MSSGRGYPEEPKPVKKKVKPRVPRTRGGQRYTEAGFFGWLRSQLRKASNKWAPKWDALKDARRKNAGPDKRRKWDYQCAACKQWWQAKEVQVDHIIPVGSLKSWSDLPGFCERLFCEKDGLQVLCTECHKRKA